MHLEKTMILIANVPQWGKIYGRDKPRFKGQCKIPLNQESYYWSKVQVQIQVNLKKSNHLN